MKVRKQFELTEIDIDRIINMAWEDRTPFEAIKAQFGLQEADVIKLMRQEMKQKSWKKWRAHVQGRATKHLKKRGFSEGRHKSRMQREVAYNNMPKKK